ncbi:hypothetical protein SUGI_0248740 [Cryptomeria japonica]|nr:hypothetical protein SUGI_0248740 [Cryptomeria japonica]
MECGVAATVASSTALIEEGLVTPDHERAPTVDEHHDYLYAVELQKSLERRSSGRSHHSHHPGGPDTSLHSDPPTNNFVAMEGDTQGTNRKASVENHTSNPGLKDVDFNMVQMTIDLDLSMYETNHLDVLVDMILVREFKYYHLQPSTQGTVSGEQLWSLNPRHLRSLSDDSVFGYRGEREMHPQSWQDHHLRNVVFRSFFHLTD